MSYTIDGQELSYYGAIPVAGKEGAALEGVFSFPKRKGESEHDWGNSVEAFVRAGEIAFEKRRLTLNMLLKTTGTAADYRARLETLKTACREATVIGTGYDHFTAFMKEGLTVKEYPRQQAALLAASFLQDTFTVPALTATPTGQAGEYYIADDRGRKFSLKRDFGIYVAERRDNNNIGKSNDSEAAPQRENPDIVLSCSAVAGNFDTLYANMRQFHALCASPGEKQIYFPGGENYRFYVRDGFTATQAGNNAVKFEFRMRRL